MKVDIIVLNWNGLGFLKACIETLYRNTGYPFRLIVCDNASKDGSIEWLKKLDTLYPDIYVHLNRHEWLSYSEGNNIGLEYCHGDATLLLNNDVMARKKGWLRQMVETLSSNPINGIVGCKLLYPKHPQAGTLIQHAGVWFDQRLQSRHIGRRQKQKKYNSSREMAAVTFACVLIRTELLRRSGLDEGYWAGTFEDLDYCCQIRNQGFKVLYEPVELTHFESATSFTLPSSFWRGIMSRNMNKFYDRWGNWLRQDMGYSPTVYMELKE